jgi:hypothetical protein
VCDCIGRHGNLVGFCWGQAGAVKDCNDDNQGNGIGSGKLGGIAVFGYMAERIRGCDGHGGASSFLVSSSNLISIAGGDGGPKGG